jgi:hypothetical protein
MDICSRCGYPLIFRNWGRNPHHPFHIPSGWHCWTLGKQASAPAAEPLQFPDGGERSEAYWEPLKDQGLRLYREYVESGRMEPFLGLVKDEIGLGNDSMVENLLEELEYRFAPSKVRNSLLRQLVVSDAWQRLRERAEIRA